jgi:hypothetical protein
MVGDSAALRFSVAFGFLGLVCLFVPSMLSGNLTAPGSFLSMALAFGAACAAFSLQIYRKSDCIFDLRSGAVTARRTTLFQRVEWSMPPEAVAIRVHEVELFWRYTQLHSWKGHAVCVWHVDEVIMVLCLCKSHEQCLEYYAQAGPALDRYWSGDGATLFGEII